MKTLLILLIGEMAGPFSGPLERALPTAFGDDPPEVRLGQNAPAGRSVVWVTLSDRGREVELLLHTARIPGDLRRVLHFGASDAVETRASTVAFALANMVHQREADLAAVLGPPASARVEPVEPSPGRLATPGVNSSAAPDAGQPVEHTDPPGVNGNAPPVEPGRVRPSWAVLVSAIGALNLPGVSWGGGLGLRLERHLVSWLSVALGAEATLFATPSSRLLAPAAMLELVAQLPDHRVTPIVSLGGGAAAWLVNHGDEQALAWVPVGRAAAGVRAEVATGHSLQVLGAVSLSPTLVRLEVAEAPVGLIGRAAVRLEFAYVGAF